MQQSNSSYYNDNYNNIFQRNAYYQNGNYMPTSYNNIPTSPIPTMQNYGFNHNGYDISSVNSYPTSTPSNYHFNRQQNIYNRSDNQYDYYSNDSYTNQMYSTQSVNNQINFNNQTSFYSPKCEQVQPQVNNDSGYNSSHYYSINQSSYASNYSNNYESNKVTENNCNDTGSVYTIQKATSKKRKLEDETHETTKSGKVEEVVEQILQDAENSKIQKLQELQVSKGQPTSHTKSKRPKIYKLDVSSTESIIKNGGQLACSQCNLTFNSNAKLLMHQHKYHGNRSSTECPICHKKFGNQANALVHLRAHTQEKNYKCTVCDNAFCDSSTLKKHMRIHTGDKPYECRLCHKRFTQSGNLKRHITIHDKYPTTSENSQPIEFNINFDFLSNNL